MALTPLPPGTLNGIIAGNVPGPDPLTIGTVTFASVECPSKLEIGALEQKIVSIELIGGGRETQSMGPQPKDVHWTGVLYQIALDGSNSIDLRVAQLQAMAAGGKEYPITWRQQRYYGKVKEFIPGFNHANRCEYDITVEITRPANGSYGNPAAPSIDKQLNTLNGNLATQNTAVVTADPTGSQSYQTPLAAFTAALALAQPIAQASSSTISNLLALLAAALTATQTYASALAQTSPAYTSAQQVVSSLTLMQRNIQQGQNSNSVTVRGVDYFEVASMQYGDVSKAFDLQAANGAFTPYTSRQTPTTIAIPPYTKA